MNYKLVLILLKKEFTELMRDKRALMTFGSMVLGLPLLYISILGITVNKAQEDSQKTLKVDLVSNGRGEDLVTFLKTMGVEVNALKSFDEISFKNSVNKLALVIPKAFDISKLSIKDKDRNTVTMYVNQKEKSAEQMGWRLERLLNNYGQSIAVRRLYIRGVNPRLIMPVQVKTINLDEKNKSTSLFLSLLGAVLIIACFMSTMYLSVDIIAGEKLRNSLEPLLVTPNSRMVYLLPKFLTIFFMILVAVVVSCTFYTEFINRPFFQNIVGMKLAINYSLSISAILLFIPLAFLAASVQLFVSTIAKSVKEAHGYTSIIGIACLFPSMVAGQLFEESKGVISYIPSVSQGLILEKLMVGKFISVFDITKSSLTSIAMGVVLLALTLKVFNSQKIFERAAQ